MMRRKQFFLPFLMANLIATGFLLSLPYPSYGEGTGPLQTTLSVFSQSFGTGDIIDPDLVQGDVFTVDIVAQNTGGLNGFDLWVAYDPAILGASADAWHGSGCSGCLFDLPGRQFLVLREKLDEPLGFFRLAMVVLGEPFTVSSGTLVRLTFTVRGVGLTQLDIREDLTILALAGNVVPYTAHDGSFDDRPIPVKVVGLDVRPGSDVNTVNVMSRGSLDVAVLGSDTFDVSTLNRDTVRFGRTGTEASPAFVSPVLQDVNGDGFPDRVFRFWVQDTGLRPGDSEARLKGRMFDGGLVAGVDFIRAFFPGDVNGDLVVNVYDLAALGAAFGSTRSSPNWNPLADFDGNHIVDVVDLAMVGSNFGQHA